MKLSTVLTACNKKYSHFIPIFVKGWQIYYPQAKIRIIYIGVIEELEKDKPKLYMYLKNLKDNNQLNEYVPKNGLSTSYVAQTIRLLYPALINDSEGVLITDIDMLPANTYYFTSPIEKFSSDCFINYRYNSESNQQIYICYNIANSSTWSEIFHIYTLQDIDNFLIKNYNSQYDAVHGGKGWFTDQELLYTYIMKWKNINNNYVTLDDLQLNFMRIDGPYFKYNKNLILEALSLNKFSDFHLYFDNCPWSDEELDTFFNC